MANQADSDSSVEELSYHNMNYEGDISSDDTSTSSNSRIPPAFPILVPIESPNLGVLITALNATSTLNRVFANQGRDLVQEIPYDSEWYRGFADPSQRSETNEDEWELSVRVELQILSAFLDGELTRTVASTANLESLLRLKVSRSEEPHLGISTLFKLLIEIPDIYQSIMQFAEVDNSRVAVLPIPIEIDDYWGNLQGAADRIFWSSVIRYTDGSEPDVSQIPVLDNLCDVLAIQCQQPDIQPDKEIWPERYTPKYREAVLRKWEEKKAHNQAITRLESELHSKSYVEGMPLTDSLKLSITSLTNAGLDSASAELSEKLSRLESEHNDLNSQITSLKESKANEDEEGSVVPIDPGEMTPYELKSLILIDNYADPGIVITRSPLHAAEWRYLHGSSTRILDWSDVLYSMQKFDNYLAFYERKKAEMPSDVAESVLNFAKEDSMELSKSVVDAADWDTDASSRADPEANTSYHPVHSKEGSPAAETFEASTDTEAARAKSADFEFY